MMLGNTMNGVPSQIKGVFGGASIVSVLDQKRYGKPAEAFLPSARYRLDNFPPDQPILPSLCRNPTRGLLRL
jgi:hypothetical protein